VTRVYSNKKNKFIKKNKNTYFFLKKIKNKIKNKKKKAEGAGHPFGGALAAPSHWG
jgi:hypothetical protein